MKKHLLNLSKILIYSLFLSFFVLLFYSCSEQEYFPKPKAYLYLALPTQEYKKFDTAYPYQFEYSKNAIILDNKKEKSEPFWLNIYYPSFGATLYVSYKKVDNRLQILIEDSRQLVMKHIPKADAINEKIIENKQDRVFGLIYDISGSGVASPYQFYITDSVKHFLRGALYFNQSPNNDSLAPIINFIKTDAEHLISSFKWKKL